MRLVVIIPWSTAKTWCGRPFNNAASSKSDWMGLWIYNLNHLINNDPFPNVEYVLSYQCPFVFDVTSFQIMFYPQPRMV